MQAIEDLYGLGSRQIDLDWLDRRRRLLWLCAAGGVVALSAPSGVDRYRPRGRRMRRLATRDLVGTHACSRR